MTKTLAQKIYDEQLRIERKQFTEPFINRVIVEPAVRADLQKKFLSSNPFFQVSEPSFTEDLTLLNFLKQADIYLPPGVNPNSSQAKDVVNQRLRQISGISGVPVNNILDLVALIENENSRVLKAINDIKYSTDSLKRSQGLFQDLVSETAKEEKKENFLTSVLEEEEEKKEEKKEKELEEEEERKEERKSLRRFQKSPFLDDDALYTLTRPLLLDYARKTLKMSNPRGGAKKGSVGLTRLSKSDLLNHIKDTQRRLFPGEK